jgi:hypothetical protein
MTLQKQVTIFDVPFALKGNVMCEGDGRDIVYCGKVKLQGDILSIYEAGNHPDGTDGSSAVVTFKISSLDSVKVRKYRSASGRFGGGRIEFVGSLGEPFKEKLVLKMEFKEYYRMKAALMNIKASLSA